MHLRGNNIGPAGTESVATALKTNTTLTNLDLLSNNLGPAGAEPLAKALESNTTLKISFWQGDIIIISVHKKIDDAHGERIPFIVSFCLFFIFNLLNFFFDFLTFYPILKV